MNYEQFATEQLNEVTAAYVAAKLSNVTVEEGESTQVPRVWFIFGDMKADMGAHCAKFFSSSRGKALLGEAFKEAFEVGLVDAVVVVTEAYVAVHDVADKVDRQEGYQVRNDPDRQDCVIAQIVLKDRTMTLTQRFSNGEPDGEVMRLGFEGEEFASSIFAPHLKESDQQQVQ